MPKPLPTRGAPARLPDPAATTHPVTAAPLPTRGAPPTLTPMQTPAPMQSPAPVTGTDVFQSAPVAYTPEVASDRILSSLITAVLVATFVTVLLLVNSAPLLPALLIACITACGVYTLRTFSRRLLGRPKTPTRAVLSPAEIPAGVLTAPLTAAEQAMFSQTVTYLTAALGHNRAQGDTRRAYEADAALKTTLPELRRSYEALPRAARSPAQLRAALRAMMQASAPDDSDARRNWDTQMRYIDDKYSLTSSSPVPGVSGALIPPQSHTAPESSGLHPDRSGEVLLGGLLLGGALSAELSAEQSAPLSGPGDLRLRDLESAPPSSEIRLGTLDAPQGTDNGWSSGSDSSGGDSGGSSDSDSSGGGSSD